jgi:glycosyltransferase involved in cell wall biosynthesis
LQYKDYKNKFNKTVGYRIHVAPKNEHENILPENSFSDLHEIGIEILHSPVQIFAADDFSIPSVLNLHDLQHFHFPENFILSELAYRNETYPCAAAKATLIIASSKFVADDIERHGFASHEKLAVIPVTWNPEVVAGLETFGEQKARSYYALPEIFAFYPAQFWLHKNHARLIEALALVRESAPDIDLHLVLTGNRAFAGWPVAEQAIQKHGVENKVLCLDRVPTGHLAGLYKAACFCIVPSTFEASSYPVIEAQVLGCPAMCSNVTSLPELMAGGAGLLFDPWNPQDIAEAMLRWLRHPEEAAAAASIASKKVRQEHSREAYTKRIISLYDSLLCRTE